MRVLGFCLGVLVCLSSSLSWAQLATLAETQSFISNELSYDALAYGGSGTSFRYSDTSLSWIRDCVFQWSATRTMYDEDGKWPSENKSYVVDLSGVGRIVIGIGWYTNNAPESHSMGLYFKFADSRGEVGESTASIPVGIVYDSDVRSEAYKNWQIYKAFNHLRKLCGAPDVRSPQFE